MKTELIDDEVDHRADEGGVGRRRKGGKLMRGKKGGWWVKGNNEIGKKKNFLLHNTCNIQRMKKT